MEPNILSDALREAVENEHRSWLTNFDPRHLRLWLKNSKSNAEDALAEAFVRRFLEGKGLLVEPGEILSDSKGGPDFLCRRGNVTFFVEVYCIRTKDAYEATGYSVNAREAIRFQSLNDKIFKAARKKASQCGKRDAPVLLAIATFSDAALLAFSPPYPEQILTGEVSHTVSFDSKTGERVGESKTTSLHSAPFLNIDGKSFKQARESIAGFLLIGLSPIYCTGVLNPFANYVFPTSALPDVSFTTVKIDEVERTLKTQRMTLP